MSSNAYQAENGSPRLLPSVVAFLDILGFNQEMRTSHAAGQSDALLQRMTRVVREWYASMGDRPQSDEHHRRIWELKAFTDNVVLGYPINWNGEAEFGYLISDIALLQVGLAHEGFFVRGGVAAGDLYMDEDIVFGVGLLDAYEAERKAVWPRIMLAESAVELVKRHLSYYASVEISPQNRALLIDEDDRLFVNYLDCSWPDRTEPPFFDWLAKHRDSLAGKLERHGADLQVWAKYLWAARYHNYFCESIPGGEAYIIDVRPTAHRPKCLQDFDL